MKSARRGTSASNPRDFLRRMITSLGKAASQEGETPDPATEMRASSSLPGVEELRALSAAAATEQGVAHRSRGIGCQDSARCALHGGLAVACVSDGLGSKRSSEVGSRLACEAACSLVGSKAEFDALFGAADNELARHVVSSVQRAIVGAAGSSMTSGADAPDGRDGADVRPELSEMGCTLLLAAVCRGRYLVCKLGDGAAFLFTGAGASRLFGVDRAEDEGSTRTVLDANAASSLEVCRGTVDPDGELGIVLTTDGMRQFAYFPSSSVVPAEMYRLYDFLAEKDVSARDEALASHLASVLPQTIGDDLGCAVIMSRATVHEAPALDLGWTCRCGLRHDYNELTCPECGSDFLSTYRIDRPTDYIGAIVTINRELSLCDDYLVDYALTHYREAGYGNKLEAILAIRDGYAACAQDLLTGSPRVDAESTHFSHPPQDPSFCGPFFHAMEQLVRASLFGEDGGDAARYVRAEDPDVVANAVASVHLARLYRETLS